MKWDQHKVGRLDVSLPYDLALNAFKTFRETEQTHSWWA